MTRLEHAPAHYRIRIHGHLDPTWSVWFDDLTITQVADGTTVLAGPMHDQAALYGLLARLRDLGAVLLAVECTTPGDPSTAVRQHRSGDNCPD